MYWVSSRMQPRRYGEAQSWAVVGSPDAGILVVAVPTLDGRGASRRGRSSRLGRSRPACMHGHAHIYMLICIHAQQKICTIKACVYTWACTYICSSAYMPIAYVCARPRPRGSPSAPEAAGCIQTCLCIHTCLFIHTCPCIHMPMYMGISKPQHAHVQRHLVRVHVLADAHLDAHPHALPDAHPHAHICPSRCASRCPYMHFQMPI